MKRTLLIFAALLFAITISSSARACAGEEIVMIQVGAVDGENGGLIDVPVLLGNCAGVDSVQFDLNYDSAALEFVSMTPGDLFAAQYTIANSDVPGRVRVACASALGLEGAGTLLTLRFRVLTDAGSAVSITSGIVTRVDADYNQTKSYVAIQDGGVIVSTAFLPAPAVTPWVPAMPVPTPSPTPETTPAPETATVLETTAQAEKTAAPAQPSNLSPNVLYIGGGLLFALVILVVVLFSRKNRKG